jgi:ABC-type uncharacterized transport system permease subunit
MYTFTPIPDVPVDHNGFFLIATFCIICLVICLFNEPESFFAWFFVATVVTGIAYGVSYHWTNQDTKVYANQKVTGTFVKFEAEGYKERSGKSYVDRHFTYVVYNVNGNNVLLSARSGVEYPQTAILYKN